MDRLVKRNFRLMTSEDHGGMQWLMSRESMGGNAGTWRKMSCVGANFLFDGKTGEIMLFSNPQDAPSSIRDKGYCMGIFRIAVDFRGTGKCRIIEFLVYGGAATRDAKDIIGMSIAEYNQVEGFPD